MTETLQRLLEPEPYYDNYPWFFSSWKKRHDRNKNVIICATGQSLGIGKSYWLLDTFEETDPDFKIEQVVFNAEQFWYAVDILSPSEWHPVLWDDPTRGLNKREWYLEVNRTVTSFMKTASRYKRKDIGFAVPTFDDLDIAVREVMTLEAQMKEAGLAKVHRIKRNKFGTPPFWKPYLGEVQRYVPKLASVYEKKREEFHAENYTKEEFQETKKTSKFEAVYEMVKADPKKYSLPSKEDSSKLKLVSRLVAALCNCSDVTARNVITKVEFEARILT